MFQRYLSKLIIVLAIINANPSMAEMQDGTIPEIVNTLKSNIKDQKALTNIERWYEGAPDDLSGLALKISLQNLFQKIGLWEGDLLDPQDPFFWVALEEELNLDSAISHIGCTFRRKGNRWFVDYIDPYGTAYSAGLKKGDALVSIGGKELKDIRSVLQRKTGFTKIAFKRTPFSKEESVQVAFKKQKALDFFGSLSRNSETIFPIADAKVGYYRLLGDSPRFQHDLKTALDRFERKTQGLILDLRGGLPSRSYGLASMFLPHKSKGEFKNPLYSKKLFVLVDSKTSGGREWLAHLLKTNREATLIGTPTAGVIFQRKNFFIGKNKWLVRIPVADPENDVGLKEGKAITPKFVVEGSLMYASGIDDTLEKTFEIIRSWRAQL